MPVSGALDAYGQRCVGNHVTVFVYQLYFHIRQVIPGCLYFISVGSQADGGWLSGSFQNEFLLTLGIYSFQYARFIGPFEGCYIILPTCLFLSDEFIVQL